VPRKKKPVEAVVAAEAEAMSKATITVEPVATQPVSSPPPPVLVAMNPEPPVTTLAEMPPKTWAVSGPHWETTINLSTQNDGPKMRLGRNNKYRQMVISFDEAPCGEVLDRLHEAAWKHRPVEGVWTLQLELGHEARGHQDAAKFFNELVALERKARGLEAVRTLSR
jgi:hypothetical protein